MRDVTLVEVHANGAHLVLADETGQQYLLAIDDQLRTAVRLDLPGLRLGAGTGPLRPREIQARIRAGMSADQLAALSGMPVKDVRRYEGPVLAEREHVARAARAVAVARSSAGDTTLAAAVDERLAARGAEQETDWDSWREEAGTWIVQVGFRAGNRSRVGQWRFDVAAASLDPIDDEARWLAGTPAPEAPAPSVRERTYDVEADGAVRETTSPGAATDGEAGSAEDPQARTLDLLEALRGRRGRRQPIDEDSSLDQPDLVDSLLEHDGQAPPPAHPAASRPQEAVDAEILSLREAPSSPQPDERTPQARPSAQPSPSARPAASAQPAASARPGSPERPTSPARPGSPTRPLGGGEPVASRDTADESETTGGAAAEQGRRRVRTSKRATVPSWDDIMFGGKKD